MTLAMALDNSFEIMNEDEMYDVNGGSATALAVVKALIIAVCTSYAAGVAVGYDAYKTWGIRFSKIGMKVFRGILTATGLVGASFSMGFSRGYYEAKG